MKKDKFDDDLDGLNSRRRVVLLCALLVLVFAFGTLGYVILEGWNAFDAFYMTVITLATIGYGETHELSTAGRAFTILLIFMGLGIFTVLVGTLSQALLEGQVNRIFDRSRKMRERVDQLSSHTIFCEFRPS